MTTTETRNQRRRDVFFNTLEKDPAWAVAKLVGYYTVSGLKEDSETAALNDTALEAAKQLIERRDYHRATILAKLVYETSKPGKQADDALDALLDVAKVCVTAPDKAVCSKGIDLLDYVYHSTSKNAAIKDRFFEIGRMLPSESVFFETADDIACAKRVEKCMKDVADAQRLSFDRFAREKRATPA
jgi:hypothetical protein